MLSVILRQAEVYGYRSEDSNPCKDIKRYRRRARERFLSPDEIRRVVEVLNRYDGTRPFQVAVIRLLLLTGCRKSELLTLKWQERLIPLHPVTQYEGATQLSVGERVVGRESALCLGLSRVAPLRA